MSASANPRASAQRHERVRRQHSDELAQDYVEAIDKRLQAGLPARVTDLQTIFGVSHVAVIRALQRLEKRDLVDRSEGDIQLTAAGQKMAAEAAARHEIVVRVLLKLGVSAAQANADAEGLEHHLSPESLRAFERFVAED